MRANRAVFIILIPSPCGSSACKFWRNLSNSWYSV